MTGERHVAARVSGQALQLARPRSRKALGELQQSTSCVTSVASAPRGRDCQGFSALLTFTESVDEQGCLQTPIDVVYKAGQFRRAACPEKCRGVLGGRHDHRAVDGIRGILV